MQIVLQMAAYAKDIQSCAIFLLQLSENHHIFNLRKERYKSNINILATDEQDFFYSKHQ